MAIKTDELLRLLILSREKVVFDGQVKTVTGVNDTGEFDILPRHQNFISLIRDRLRYRLADGTAQQLTMRRGIMHVYRNTVRVFMGLVEEPETAKAATPATTGSLKLNENPNNISKGKS